MTTTIDSGPIWPVPSEKVILVLEVSEELRISFSIIYKLFDLVSSEEVFIFF